MSFKSEHPDFKGYESDEYYVVALPTAFSSALQGFLTRHCDGTNELKSVLNDIASRIPMEPTTNWGWDFLIEDMRLYVARLCKSDLPKAMDFLADLATNRRDSFSQETINEFLYDLDIGYELETEKWSGNTHWKLRPTVSSRSAPIKDAAPYVKNICQQALDHLDQAKDHLSNTNNDRDRKDAVRDCLSAMESLLKSISGKNDIKDATTFLRAEKTWGLDIIVKDGLSLWNRMQDLYPDVRHGNPNKTEMTDEEALYWVERITCFIKYISRKHDVMT
ncbi:hypothetical protein [Novispirillum itersonii]|uniref:Uncharacterized protein n=1 Tax=Novispirillum itersonii TaxID=189 RepID=A0A7X0DM81_NOVIT|nr:hypothetical protein [Novispirillum itersonii]MBB6210783.1 hypothetical protein [Novispirillum itersonii]